MENLTGCGFFLPDHQRGIGDGALRLGSLSAGLAAPQEGSRFVGRLEGVICQCCIPATSGILRPPSQSTRMPWISRYLRTQPLNPWLHH